MGGLESCCNETNSQAYEYDKLANEQFVEPDDIHEAWQDLVQAHNLLSLPYIVADDDWALESPITRDGKNALLYYADEGWLEGVQFLVDRMNCNRNFTHARTGDTALHVAARKGHSSIIVYLLGSEADHTIANRFGETPDKVCSSKKDKKHFDAVAIQQRRSETRKRKRTMEARRSMKKEKKTSKTSKKGGSGVAGHPIMESSSESLGVDAISAVPRYSQISLDLGAVMENYRLTEASKGIQRSIEERTFRDIKDPDNEEYFMYKSVQTELARQLAIELDVLATLFRRSSFEVKYQWWSKITDYDESVYAEAVNAELRGESKEKVRELAAAAARRTTGGKRRKKFKRGRPGASTLDETGTSYSSSALSLDTAGDSMSIRSGAGGRDPKLLAHAKYLPRMTGAHELTKLLTAVVSRLKAQHIKSSAFRLNPEDIRSLMTLVKAKFTPDNEDSIARITLLEGYLSEQSPLLMGFGFGDYTDESDAEPEHDAAVLLGWSEREIKNRSIQRKKKRRKEKRRLKKHMILHNNSSGGRHRSTLDDTDPLRFMEDEDLDTEIDEEKRRMLADGRTRRLTFQEILKGEEIVELEDLSHKFGLTFDDFVNKFSEALFYIHDELHIKWVKWNKAERKRARKEQERLERKEREEAEEAQKRMLEAELDIRGLDEDEFSASRGGGDDLPRQMSEEPRRGRGHSRGRSSSSMRDVLSRMRSASRSHSSRSRSGTTTNGEGGSGEKKKKRWFHRKKSKK